MGLFCNFKTDSALFNQSNDILKKEVVEAELVIFYDIVNFLAQNRDGT